MFHRGFQLVGREQFILRREQCLIRSQGPTLGSFAEAPDQSTVFTEQLSPDGKVCSVGLKNDNNSNIRLFYYCLLCVCFEKDCHKQGQQYSNKILLNFKMQIYSQGLRFDQFSCGEIEERFRPIYKDASMKKILVEFLQLMNYSECGVLEMLKRYPVIDMIMVIAIRSILYSTSFKYTKVSTQLLAEYLNVVIGMKLVKGANSYNISGTRISIVEQDSFSFMLKEPFLKSRRSSLANNYSTSDSKTNERLDEGFEISPPKLVKHQKSSRLTGLQYQDVSPRRQLLSHRGKQQSLDPTSLDFDNILMIPKHPALSIGPQDKDILVIPPRNIEIDDFVIRNQTNSGINPRLSRPYQQDVRMTEDPRWYMSKNGIPQSSAKPLQEEIHEQQPSLEAFCKVQYPIARQINRIETPFLNGRISSGKSQKALGIDYQKHIKIGQGTTSPKTNIQVHFPKHPELFLNSVKKAKTTNLFQNQPY